MNGFDIERLGEVQDALEGRVIRTPVLPLQGSKIAALLPEGSEVFMKLELFQHTGSFKARGALLGVDWLEGEQAKSGVATFSGGNHALAVAWASRQGGVPAKVIMPKAADPLRIQGCQELGADVVLAEDIAAAAVFLGSDECYMTGQNLQVNGGLTLRRNPLPSEIEESVMAAMAAQQDG